MNLVLIITFVIVALFALAFVTKRRFGVLGLALAAGAMLSNVWAAKLTPLVAQAGVVSDNPPLETLVAASVVLLPALFLLFSGPSYHNASMRVGGAFCFALLATVFLMEPIGGSLVLMDQNKQIYDWLLQNRVYIVTAGLLLAIFDLLSLHTGIGPRPTHKKHH